jgi:hypothetical protein
MFNDLNQIFALENNTLNPIETNESRTIYSRESEFIRRPCPYRIVPFRFPRGTVLVNRRAYRTF